MILIKEQPKIKNADLSEDQKKILFEKKNERAFTGKYLNHHDDGSYVCANCGTKLFSSKTKFDSGTGWPSFSDAENVELKKDLSHFMIRTEVVCKKCGAHLGHVFNDGPKPTKKRYCINSACLNFNK